MNAKELRKYYKNRNATLYYYCSGCPNISDEPLPYSESSKPTSKAKKKEIALAQVRSYIKKAREEKSVSDGEEKNG